MDEENNKTLENEQDEYSLSKEEILARSRLENKNGDEMYKKNSNRAVIFGVLFSLLFFVAIFIAEQILSEKIVVAPAVICILWAITGGTFLFKGIFNKDKTAGIVGILCLGAAIMSYVIYISCLLK